MITRFLQVHYLLSAEIDNDRHKKIHLNDRILTLSKLAGQIRREIQPARNTLSPDVFQNLTNLESSLFNLSKQTSEYEEERGKLLALTDTP